MEEHYEKYFDEMPCSVTVQDLDFRILDGNRRFREVFGDCIGAYCYKACKGLNESCPDCPALKTIQDGEPHTQETLFLAGDGREQRVLLRTAPLRDASGKTTAFMEMALDPAEIPGNRAEIESQGLLVGAITHGIRGQLTGLDGGMYLMNSGCEKNKPDRVQNGLSMVQRNLQRIRTIVVDILYYVKDRVHPFERIDAEAFLGEFVGVLEKKAAEVGAQAECSVAEGVQDFVGSPLAMRSMLINLIDYALDPRCKDPDKEKQTVRFSVSQDTSHTVFSVQDNGVGLSDLAKEGILSPLFSPEGIESTGLGLVISKKIAVKIHGGTMVLCSERKVGTTVEIKIPRGLVPDD